jgi:tetratricopeptide (TPR) repeat protein
MRTINIRFLLVSLGLAAIVSVGANLLHDIQVRRSANILLTLANQRIKDGKPHEALSYLTRYSRLAPQNVDAQVQLANTLADMGRLQEAIKWYERALLRDAGRHDARRRLVEASISVQQYSSAKTHIQDFLLEYNSDDARVYYLLARCHEGLGEYVEAISRYNEAIGLDSKLIEAYSRLADLYRTQQKNSEDADARMNQLVEAHPNDPQARIARADYRAKYHLTGVLDDVREAVRLAPEDVQILFRASRTAQEVAVETRDPEALLAESEDYARKGLGLEPRFAGWYLALAQVDRNRGDIDKGIAHIEQGLSALPDNGDLQWNLADFLIQNRRIDDGLGLVRRLGDQGYPEVPLEYLIAVSDAQRNRFVDAVERFRKIREALDAWPDLARQTEYWLGFCYQHLGEYGLQLTSFRNAVKIDPAWIPARHWLANALARTGRIDEAITEYEELTKMRDRVPKEVFQEFTKLLVLRELQRKSEDRDWARVTAHLDQAEKVDAESDGYLILRAEIHAAEKRTDDARKTLVEGIKSHPKSKASRLALAALEQSEENWDAADTLIQETEQQFGDNLEVRLARVRFLIQRHGLEAYEKIQVSESKPLEAKPEEQQAWRTNLAAAYYTLGKYPDAGRLWNEALSHEPDNILLHMFLFDLALSDSDDKRMQELLTDIRRVERSDQQPLWRYGEATRMVMQARKGDVSALSKAESYLEEVRSARQIWARVPLLQAEIDEIRGRYDQVVEHYLAAIDLGERSPTIIRRVVELLYRERRYSDADQVLQKLEAMQLPITGDLGRLAADVSFRVQDFSRAMQIAMQVIGKSDSYKDLVWMGQLHSVMRQPDDAQKKLREAIQREPKLPDAWIALVQHLARIHSVDKARLAIEALTKNVEPDSVAFVQGVCLDALRDVPAAAQKFSEATQPESADAIVLRVAGEFYMSHGLPAKAEPLLQRLIAHTKVQDADTRWARRNLAVVWLASGDAAATQKAAALVEENLKGVSPSSEDRRAKALCLDSLGSVAQREEALAIVQDLINSRQSTPDDYLLAYRLCVRLDRTTEARDFLEEYTFANSGSSQALIRYIGFLLGKEEFSEAKRWIERLNRLCEDDLKRASGPNPDEAQLARIHQAFVATATLKAQLLVKQNDHKAAATSLMQSIGAADKTAPLTLSVIETAETLETLGRQTASVDENASKHFLSAGETLLRSSVGKSPRQAVALIALLCRQGQTPEALKLWHEHFTPTAADEFSLAAAALAAQPETSRAELHRLIERVQSARNDKPSKAFLTGLGQLLSFDGQHAEVVAVYRQMLAQEPTDINTINNLACYLALSGINKEEALKLIDSAIQITGPTASLLDSRGMILLEMNRPEEAVGNLQQALQMAKSGSMYLHLAAAQKQLNKDSDSTKSLEEARKLGLDINRLHPLERVRYENLLKQASL